MVVASSHRHLDDSMDAGEDVLFDPQGWHQLCQLAQPEFLADELSVSDLVSETLGCWLVMMKC